MTHTPGPWTWWTSNSWRRLKHDDRGKTLNVLEPTVCHDGQPDCIISQEDMVLIAAAPDLLEALKGVLRIADRKHDAFDAARAAIEKAEGQP